MKVIIDFDLCEENAVCMDLVPDVFYFGGADDSLQIRQEAAADVTEAALREAVRQCPRGAIRIE
ncbi:MAG: ferredoxin [Bradymonadia bacterium]|jgi:ferredoxin